MKKRKGALASQKEQNRQQILHNDNNFYRLLVESLEDYVIFTTDKSGNVNSWNPGAEKILRYKEKEIIGKNASLFYIAVDKKEKVPEKELQKSIRVREGTK